MRPRMPLPVAINPHAQCPVPDTAVLTALYDNNASQRNQADLQALQACSAAAFESATLAHQRIKLGEGESAWADIFRPRQGTGLLPAVLFVHGGRWQLNTSRETVFWAQACGDAGLAFVGLNFPPLSAVGLTAQIAHVALVAAAVHARAAALGLDANALVLGGHSSGAHLALSSTLLHPPRVMPRALLLLGGLYDLAPLRATAHQASLGFSVEDAERCSPLNLLHRASTSGQRLSLPPTLVAVGADESAEFMRQSRAVHWALQKHTAAGWFEVPGCAHFDAALAFNNHGPGAEMLTFLTTALREDPP